MSLPGTNFSRSTTFELSTSSAFSSSAVKVRNWPRLYPQAPIFRPSIGIVQSITRQQLDEYGWHEAEPSDGFNHYTLTGPGDDARRFPGTIDRTEVRNLDPAIDRVSLVIHHHRSPEEALAYYEGLVGSPIVSAAMHVSSS
jgi:hypothetical protein